MQVSDFIDVVGNYLQEDFSTSPVWTQLELLDYTRQVYRTFCALTGLVDKTEIRLINGTTGEADVPKDFDSLQMAQFEQRQLDIVELDELDFVSGTWASGTTGTPNAVTVIGSGDNAVVRYVPVPSSVWDGGFDYTLIKTGLTVGVGASQRYTVSVLSGVLYTTAAVAGAYTNPVLPGVGNYWQISTSTDGELITTLVGTTVTRTYALLDGDGSGLYWVLTCTADGELVTSPEYLDYGLGVSALVDYGDYMDFTGYGGGNAEHGVITDLYADGSATSPSYVGRANSSRGLSLYAHTSDETGMLWYKGALPELGCLYSELKIRDAFVPVLLHGVLSLAYAQNGDGQDTQKAELMTNVFIAECEAIRRSFQYRWA